MVQLRSLSYDKSDVVLVCFSVADPAMFVNVEKFWVNEIRSYLPRTPFLLVGTHLDVKDQRTSVSRLIIHNNQSSHQNLSKAVLLHRQNISKIN